MIQIEVDRASIANPDVYKAVIALIESLHASKKATHTLDAEPDQTSVLVSTQPRGKKSRKISGRNKKSSYSDSNTLGQIQSSLAQSNQDTNKATAPHLSRGSEDRTPPKRRRGRPPTKKRT